MSLQDDMDEAMEKVLFEIANQREEILRTFIAKYGFEPEECEQVLDMSDYANGVIRWSIRRKEKKNNDIP